MNKRLKQEHLHFKDQLETDFQSLKDKSEGEISVFSQRLEDTK